MAGDSKQVNGGEPGLGATIERLEHYLRELLTADDRQGEAAFVREEIIRRIAALKAEERAVERTV